VWCANVAGSCASDIGVSKDVGGDSNNVFTHIEWANLLCPKCGARRVVLANVRSASQKGSAAEIAICLTGDEDVSEKVGRHSRGVFKTGPELPNPLNVWRTWRRQCRRAVWERA